MCINRFVSALFLGFSLIALGYSVTGVAAKPGREEVLVDNATGLLNNIWRDNIVLVLAPGLYVVDRCGGVEVDDNESRMQERSDPTCGEMQQGKNSVLRSSLELELDENGVPTGGDDLTSGAVIDCSSLPPSPPPFRVDFSCLVAGAGSTIRNLTILNGSETPDPRGTAHRNGIMILPGKEATIDEVRLENTRRGVLFTTKSGKKTSGAVRHSLIEGTELAGVFLWVRNADGSATHNSRLDGEAKANRLGRIGLHPLLLAWAFSGTPGEESHHNDSHAEFTDNIVDDTNIRGISIVGRANADTSAHDNSASFEIEGGSLEGSLGLFIATVGGGVVNSNNTVEGTVKNLTIENGMPAVLASLRTGWGDGNTFLLEMKNSNYVGESMGEMRVIDDSGSKFQIVGSPTKFLERNWNFDISAVNFTDDDD